MPSPALIFSRREVKAATGFILVYAILALGLQVFTGADQATPTFRLHASAMTIPAEGIAEAVALPALAFDTANTG